MKAIETIYRGYRMRSRLEARWAVFFDTLGIEYRYELEGFELHGIRYLPDFYLPQLDCWIEIKPTTPSPEEREKAIRLCMHTEQHVYIFAGDVWSDVKVYAFSFDRATTQDILDLFQGYSHRLHWLSTREFVGQDAYRRFHWGRFTASRHVGRVYLGGMPSMPAGLH